MRCDGTAGGGTVVAGRHRVSRAGLATRLLGPHRCVTIGGLDHEKFFHQGVRRLAGLSQVVPEHARDCFRGGCRSRASRRSRGPHAQPQEHRRLPAAGPADHHHRRQRVREVVARLRHHLCRRTAPLCRVAVRLRPAVPRAHGEAGRRPDRRHLRRRLPFARRTASATRARRSARRPKSTTTCGCSTPASGGRSAARAGGRSCAKRPRSSPAGSASCRRARGSCSDSTCRLSSRSRRRAESPEVDELHEQARPGRRRTARRTRRMPPRRVRVGRRPSDWRESAAAAAPASTAVAAVIGSLRRKGFGRLLIDNQALAFDDVEPARLANRSTCRSSSIALQLEPARTTAPAADRFDRDRVPRRRRCGVGDRTSRRAGDAARRPAGSPSASSAGRAASPTRIRSRGCSRSTTRSARVRPATASATSSSSTWISSCPTRRNRFSRARSSRGASRTTARSSPT